MKRNYERKDVVMQKFDSFLHEMRASGQLILPGERELAQVLGCSRNLVREILTQNKEDGLIIHKGRHRSLSMEKATGEKVIGSFLYVASGEGDVANPAWSMLWRRTQELAQRRNIKPELCLISHNDSENKFLQKIEDGPEIVLVASTPSSEILRLIKTIKGKHFIYLDENLCSPEDDLVVVDNYEAGWMAAREFAEKGYTRPAILMHKLIINGRPYLMFENRAKGFRAGCRRFGINFQQSDEYWVEADNRFQYMLRIAKMVREIVANGHDCAYVFSDNEIDFIYCAFLEEGVSIPEDFGLMTKNSFNVAMSHNPPISSVGNTPNGVSASLVELLYKLLCGEIKKCGRCYVKPDFLPGKTLRNKKAE